MQKTNCEEALELLKLAIELNKSATLSLILLYDELNSLFECRILQPAIIEWLVDYEICFIIDTQNEKF